VSHNYQDLMSARRGILLEACEILNGSAVQYVVAGGWVPYLRSSGHRLNHPGTKDVDLLFNDDPGPIQAAVRNLIGAGYVPSAKHSFQLLKELPVQDRRFVFNVDLMHPREAEIKRFEDMFEDIIDLGIREDYDAAETRTLVKSICFPSARIIFDRTLWTSVETNATLPNGQASRASIPLMDECGLVLSKCESVSGKKRDRDAFDIYFVLSGPRAGAIANEIRVLSARFPQVAKHLCGLKRFLRQDGRTFEGRVSAYCDEGEGSAEKVLRLLFTS
jgi:hypothetical protein